MLVSCVHLVAILRAVFFYPLCNTHIVTPEFMDRPHRGDCSAVQVDGEAGW